MKKHFADSNPNAGAVPVHKPPYCAEPGHVGSYPFPSALRLKHTNTGKRAALTLLGRDAGLG